MRDEDYDRELLAAVTLICAALATVVSAFETTTPSVAGAAVQRLEQVRIVGTPFVPNTNPSVR